MKCVCLRALERTRSHTRARARAHIHVHICCVCVCVRARVCVEGEGHTVYSVSIKISQGIPLVLLSACERIYLDGITGEIRDDPQSESVSSAQCQPCPVKLNGPTQPLPPLFGVCLVIVPNCALLVRIGRAQNVSSKLYQIILTLISCFQEIRIRSSWGLLLKRDC